MEEMEDSGNPAANTSYLSKRTSISKTYNRHLKLTKNRVFLRGITKLQVLIESCH